LARTSSKSEPNPESHRMARAVTVTDEFPEVGEACDTIEEDH